MPRFAFLPAALLAASLLTPPPALADAAEAVARSMAAADRDDWTGAEAAARAAGDPVAMDLAIWRRLSDGAGEWREFSAFVARNPDWPGIERIRAKGEAAIPRGASLGEIDAFLGPEGPRTGAGFLRRSEALVAAGRRAEADEEIVRGWRGFSLTASEQADFRAGHSGAIRPHHETRADELLWRGLVAEAEAMKPLVSPGWAALIDARVALRSRAKGVDGLIARVPAALQNDPGLAYERFIWRMKRDDYDGAYELIAARSGSVESLGRPEMWGERRLLLARRLERLGRIREAYNLANQNHMLAGADFAECEWLAGWIALRELKDPARAEAHFRRFIPAVETPISLGRGWYWLGRALEAKGDASGARAAYQEAAAHQTSFYGQLAAEAIGAPVDPTLANGRDGDRKRLAERSLARAAELLNAAGDRARAHRFLVQIAYHHDGYDDLAAAAHLAVALGRPDAAIRIGKVAARKGQVLKGDYYPVTELASLDGGVEPALAMAIGRQESELNPEAVSPAGARGLMQVMPATARKVAGWVGLPYSLDRLTDDWRYNATLGQAYLARRLSEYGGSVALAAAAYNAGAGRVDQWLAQYGDPRTGQVDWIDWIETIPFSETRNYVQRVLEGLQVYRSRIAGKPVAFRLKADALGRKS